LKGELLGAFSRSARNAPENNSPQLSMRQLRGQGFEQVQWYSSAFGPNVPNSI
jgi:hypothetical protein